MKSIARRQLFIFMFLLFCLTNLSIWTTSAQQTTPRQLPVDAIAISGDGSVIAASYRRGYVEFLDSATGDVNLTVNFLPYAPLNMSLSPTGDRLVWTDFNHSLGIYDTNTMTNTILIEEGTGSSVSWNPVSDTFAVANDVAVQLFDASSGESLGFIDSGINIRVESIAWSPDGQTLVTSLSRDFMIHGKADDLFETVSRIPSNDMNGGAVRLLKTGVSERQGLINSATVGPSNVTSQPAQSTNYQDDRPVFAIQIWNNISPHGSIIDTPLKTITDRGGGSVDWSPDGIRFAVGERDGFLVYNLATDTIETTVSITGDGSEPILRWSPDGGLLAAGGNRIRVWNTETWELIRTIELVGDWSFELEWSPNSQYIFHGGGPDGLYIDAIYPDLGQDNNLQTPVYRIAKSGDGRIIAVTYRTTNIEFFDGLAGELISTADLSPIAPRSIALSPSGDRLVWLEANSRVAVYNTDSATNTYLSGGPSFIDAVVWNPVNELAGYIGSISATFHDAKTGMSYSHLLARDTPALISVAWSPDGQQLAASHSANPAFDPNGDLIAITLWGDSLLAGGFIDTPQMVIKGRGGGMIEWSPDGERFAVLERDGFLVYDVATDSIEEKVIFDANILDELRWSPDGSLVATGGTVIRIWDTETWEEVGTISTYGSPATSHQWSADGQHIFHNGGHDGLYMDALPPEILTTPAP